MRVVTSDLQEAITAVSHVYCPHEAKVLESNRGIEAVLESSGVACRQVVTLRCSRKDRRRYVREPVVIYDLYRWCCGSDARKPLSPVGEGADLAAVAKCLQPTQFRPSLLAKFCSARQGFC